MLLSQVIVTLKNGLRVGNFSSPHDFTFDDGTILPAVSPKEAERLKVQFIEKSRKEKINNVHIENIQLTFTVTDAILDEMYLWDKRFERQQVDIVLIPLPMLTALKAPDKPSGTENKWTLRGILESPFRCVRIEDRNNKVISSTKFCV